MVSDPMVSDPTVTGPTPGDPMARDPMAGDPEAGDIAEVPGDDPDLVALVADQFAEIESRYADVDDHGFAQPPLHPRTRWLLLRAGDGTPAGCVAVQPLSHTRAGAPADVGEIKRLYVVPAYRRRGWSLLLMARAEQLAATAGYTSLVLETGTRQPEAVALYERTGWEPIAPYGHYRDSPLTRCYRKPVPPPAAARGSGGS